MFIGFIDLILSFLSSLFDGDTGIPDEDDPFYRNDGENPDYPPGEDDCNF